MNDQDDPSSEDLELEQIDSRIEELFDELPPDEIEAEARENGEHPEESAAEVRRIFARVYKQHMQKELWEAQSIYEQQKQLLINLKANELPETPDEQIALLVAIRAAQPQLLEPFTVKYREFESLSVADRESLLRQLKALGVLDAIYNNDRRTL